MNKQTEITQSVNLLDPKGDPLKPGYCKRNLYVYNREAVKNKLRLKEWDFYQISDGKKNDSGKFREHCSRQYGDGDLSGL